MEYETFWTCHYQSFHPSTLDQKKKSLPTYHHLIIVFYNVSSQFNKLLKPVFTPLIMALNAGSLKCVVLLLKVLDVVNF